MVPYVRLHSFQDMYAIEYNDGEETHWILYSEQGLAVAARDAMKRMLFDESPVSVAEFVDRWIRYHVLLKVQPPATLAYLRYLRQLARHFVDKPLEDVRAADIDEYVRLKREAGLTEPCLTRILNVWSSLFTTAQKWMYIEGTNPVIEFRASQSDDSTADQ